MSPCAPARAVPRLPVALALLAAVLTVPLASSPAGPGAPDVAAAHELIVQPGRSTSGDEVRLTGSGTARAGFAVPGRPPGGSLWLALQFQDRGTHYRARARILSSGAVSVEVTSDDGCAERVLAERRAAVLPRTEPSSPSRGS